MRTQQRCDTSELSENTRRCFFCSTLFTYILTWRYNNQEADFKVETCTIYIPIQSYDHKIILSALPSPGFLGIIKGIILGFLQTVNFENDRNVEVNIWVELTDKYLNIQGSSARI